MSNPHEFRQAAVLVVIGLVMTAILPGCTRAVRRQPETRTPAPPDGWRMADPVVRAANRGVAMMDRYDYAAAVESFERAVVLAPESADLRVNLAIALYNRSAKGDLERAEKLFDEVLAADPDHLRALYFRGITHQYSGRDEPAVACFERVTQLAPHDAFAWYLLARGKAHLEQPCRAELERAIQENPALVSAYYDLMRVARQEGDTDQALAYQEKFVRLRESPLAETLTIPHYRRMGPLAMVTPLPTIPQANPRHAELSIGPARTLLTGFCPGYKALRDAGEAHKWNAELRLGTGGLALADVNGDGHLDMAVVTPGQKVGQQHVMLLLGQPDRSFINATASSGITTDELVSACSFGDYDGDGNIDLFISCYGPNHLFRGRGDGTFVDATSATGTAGGDVSSTSAVFLDADHDGDLDIYVSNTHVPNPDGTVRAAVHQLLNNNADGTFTDIAPAEGMFAAHAFGAAMVPADMDNDRDADLVLFGGEGTARFLFNDRMGRYHERRELANRIFGALNEGEECPLVHSGVVLDFDGDQHHDILVASRLRKHFAQLFLTHGNEMPKKSVQFSECLAKIARREVVEQIRAADIDLDGDLDIALFGEAGHVLLNDGAGRFTAKAHFWPNEFVEDAIAIELVDLTDDGVADLLVVTADDGGTVKLVPTKLDPPAGWIAITPTGDRGEDQRPRSPVSGYGTKLELHCGLHRQTIHYTGLNGGRCQSQVPVIFGLSGATQADYLAITWPDGVTQCETDLAAGKHHRISEMERRVSSCPVLFAWNGVRFGFIGDFAGVGGMGYYVAPGEAAPPQPLEHVKLEPDELVARDGFYELRVCEPMEEVAYIDRLELVAVDHAEELSVYPDERLTITGPPPSHRLLCPDRPVFPRTAHGPNGSDCAERLLAADRHYAYTPTLDPRFCGFCERHALTLDFGDTTALAARAQASRRIYLFLNGWIEYPYSQTTFAAAQAGVEWEPLRVELCGADGVWRTIVPDAGAPGGMSRTITIDLTEGLLAHNSGVRDVRLRISTNLEIYFDQAFIAADRGTADLVTHRIAPASAELRWLGFPREHSPDGQHPTIYTYDVIDPTSSFKIPRGWYTRYGPVDELLTEFDDRYVILGTGDEIAVRFDARVLPPVEAGMARSFILVSHAYCKDMDLYTAEPDTVEPLPFRQMGSYPYGADEHYPDGEDAYRRRFNTRPRP